MKNSKTKSKMQFTKTNKNTLRKIKINILLTKESEKC